MTNITGGGVFSPLTKTVEWGLFTDSVPRTVTYDLVPGTNRIPCETFAGLASFDGVNAPVIGQRCIQAADAASSGVTALNSATTHRIVSLAGDPNSYLIEASTAAGDWIPVTQVLCGGDQTVTIGLTQ